MTEEKRMAGDYEITAAFHIGDKEVVMGENPANPDERYMVGYCEKNEIFASYGIVLTSENYADIAKQFGECRKYNSRYNGDTKQYERQY